ncbi:MAG: AAA family ATPase, partial [Chloroflexi bacterium]|nr:AAA family ATPase [Chloroflexota bacterium]
MRERLEQLNRRWASRIGQTLALHIGVNTGTVIAGNVGSDLRLSYTVMGDTVNTASRLEDVAQPGQILVSRDTYRVTSEAFQFQVLEPVVVKGKREPLTVFELLRAKLNPMKTRGLQGLSSRLVGREHEREQLRAVLDDLLAGRGRMVTVEGEAGLGKSRLMSEWRAEMGERVRWLEGRSYAHTTGVAYGPFIDLFRRFAGIQDDDSELSARGRLQAVVQGMFGHSPEAQVLFASMLAMRLSPDESSMLATMPAQVVRERLFATIADLLERNASERPIVLVIEDMHWADATSMELVEALLPLIERVPLAIVGVFRDHPDLLTSKLMRAGDTQYATRRLHLQLSPLSESDSVEMIEHLLSLPTVPDSLRELIVAKAEGNPFFVEEVIRTLIERGALMRADGHGWTATSLIKSITVPDTLQGLLMARLDRLPDETKWVVQQASV